MTSRGKHYRTKSDLEAKHVIAAWDLDFYLGNVIKYIGRLGEKEGVSEEEDLLKCRDYIDLKLERIRHKSCSED